MSERRFFNVLFLRPIIGGQRNRKLSDSILPAVAAADLPSRSFPWDNHVMKFEGVGHRSGAWSGDAVKLTPDLVEMKGKVEEEGTEPIVLDEGECIARETAFYYEAEQNVLVIQKNHFGASIAVFEYFFSRFGDSVSLVPIVGMRNREERLSRIRGVTSVSFDIDVPALRRAANPPGGIATGIEEAARQVDAHKATVTLKVGRRNEELRRVPEALRVLLGPRASEYVLGVKVGGRDEGIDRTTLIDILEPTVIRRVSVRLSEGVATLPARINALQEALSSAEGEFGDGD